MSDIITARQRSVRGSAGVVGGGAEVTYPKTQRGDKCVTGHVCIRKDALCVHFYGQNSQVSACCRADVGWEGEGHQFIFPQLFSFIFSFTL